VLQLEVAQIAAAADAVTATPAGRARLRIAAIT
jgi:hypothetical protein